MGLNRRVASLDAEKPIGNIELLFLYIEEFKNLKNIQLNFSGEGFYYLEKIEDGLKLFYK